MSVGQQYTNPTTVPCSGNYTWVPATPSQIGGFDPTVGFDNLIIDRGKFRNYYVSSAGKSTINVVASGTFQGNPYSPIINATRPLSINGSVQSSNNNNFVVQAQGSNLIEFDFSSTDAESPISCIQLTYDLSYWIGDPTLGQYNLNTIQSAALSTMQSNGSVDNVNITNFIDGLQPFTVNVIGVDNSGKQHILTAGLNLTRLRNNQTESGLQYATTSGSSPSVGPTFVTVEIKTADDLLNRRAYPEYSKIILSAQFGSSSMVLVLKKIMFFTADRVNFRYTTGVGSTASLGQLPCSALGYSIGLSGNFYPTFSDLYWPQDNALIVPNIHIKVFNPDDSTNSPGFAHSLNLHLLILSFPTYGPLAGVPLPYFGVIIGPTPFTTQFIFTGTNIPNDITQQLVDVASTVTKASSGTVSLLQNSQSTGFSRAIYSYTDVFNLIQSGQYIYNFYEYSAIGVVTSTLFQNSYLDQNGLNTLSEAYTGAPLRVYQYLNAYENLPSENYSNKNYSYSTYITVTPNLYDIFTKSDPCLIFKCQSDGFSSNIFQEPGFLSASINCAVKDGSGLFDTKLIYRIYALPTGTTDYNPNNTFAINHTLKITNTLLLPGFISFTSFNSSWDFTNVLVSGDIESISGTITTEVIINSEQDTFVIASSSFDIYCAVYAVSTPNDSPIFYSLSNLSSLNLPVITFSISNNFTLVLPIYYSLSENNGGYLQAVQDFGYNGKYTADNNAYYITNLYYNGSPFNTKLQYSNTLNATNNYSMLLTMIQSNSAPPPSSTQFSILINAGTQSSPVVTETDYVMLVNDTAYAKINTGNWILNFNVDSKTTIKNLNVRFEIDLVNVNSNTLIMKVLSSPYQVISANVLLNVTVPFYLPDISGIFILKIFVQNNKSEGVLYIDQISFAQGKNTLSYFLYTGSQSPIAAPIGFYEDLPIEPETFVGGCDSFLLVLDLPSSGSVIYDPSVGMYIDGSIYSPTWVVALPSEMEMQYISDVAPVPSGQDPYQVYFRTGISNSVQVLDTKRHKSTGLIITLTNQPSTSASTNNVTQIVSESFARFFTSTNTLQTVSSNSNSVSLNINNPIMSKSEELLIQGQNSSNQTFTLNAEGPSSPVSQPAPVGVVLPVDNPSAVKIRLPICPYSVFDYKDHKTFTVGITAQGNVLYIEDQITSFAGSYNIKLIEGNPGSSELSGFNIGANNTQYYGLANVSYPGIIVTKSDDVIVLYVYASGSSVTTSHAIYARYINGSSISVPILIFDFKVYASQSGAINYTFPSINQITVCKDEIYSLGNVFYIEFDCLGKIFILKLVYNQHNFYVSSLAMVYGNLGTSSDTNEQAFITTLLDLINSSLIYRLNYLSNSFPFYTQNIEGTQRIGFVDYDGKFFGIQFLDGTNVMEVVFDKSYAVYGELRQIGSAMA